MDTAEGKLPLCPLLRPHLEFCALSRDAQLNKDMKLTEGVQWRATKIMRGLKHLPYEERLGLLSLVETERESYQYF